MRTVTFAATLAVTALFVADALAQRGGGRRRQPEEITNRTGLFFSDIAGPKSDGDKVADLGTLELVRAARSANQLSVLYLVNESDDQRIRQTFEWQLGRDTELGVLLRAYHCGRIELSKEAALAKRYAKKAPLFVVFGKSGKATEVSMAGYKPSTNVLKKALEKSASGAMKPPITTFAKKYGKMIHELEALLRKRDDTNAKLAKAGRDAGKRKKAEKELKKLEDEQRKLLEQEKELLIKARLPERTTGAKRLGARRGGRGEGNGRGTGTGRGGRNGG